VESMHSEKLKDAFHALKAHLEPTEGPEPQPQQFEDVPQ
jgi:hypothetical protein